MTGAIIDRVLNLASNDLDPIVQAVLNDHSATATGSLSCEPIGAISVGIGTEAILKVAGEANTDSGKLRWSVVIKATVMSGSDITAGDPRVEVEAYDSDLFDAVNTGMRAPRCYRVQRLEDRQVWLWLEDLSGMLGPPWGISDYARASKHVGHFAGYWGTQNLPSAQFLRTDNTIQYSLWSNFGSGFMRLRPDEVVESVIKKSLSESDYFAAMKLGTSVGMGGPVVRSSPQLLVHGDCHPRNLFLSPDNAAIEEAVAFDWASIGTGHISTDIGNLVGSGLTWHEDEFRSTIESESQFYEGFLTGIALGGWQGDPDLARLNYLFGVCQYGMRIAGCAAVIDQRLGLHEFFVDRCGESSAEAALDAYASRLERMSPLAEELESLVGQLQ